MRKIMVTGLGVAVAIAALPAADAQGLRDRLRGRHAEQAASAEGGAPAALAATTIAYGQDPLQELDFWPAANAGGPAPLIVYVHGGGWQAEALEAALKAAGTRVERRGFPGTGLMGHMEINRSLGDPGDEATAVTDGWLKAVLAGR